MEPIVPANVPTARLKKRARFSLVWLVPAIAAIAAGWLVFQNVRKIGPAITIQFNDGSGLQANQTVLRYRGVQIGNVDAVELTDDAHHVLVRARLERAAATLAREDSVFWVVRPELGAGGLHGLETIVSGPYIQVQPGTGSGKPQRSFVGAETAPILPPTGGTEFVLQTASIGSLAGGSPVYYRGIQVGSVQYLGLSPNSTLVNVHVLIKPNFVPLVRTNSVFWNAGGINVNLHFFGINVSAENFESLVMGGVAFATPDDAGRPAAAGAVFSLYDKPDNKWLLWSPSIALTNASVATPAGSPSSPILNNLNQTQK
jgi:paraquat-inducible protein B